MIGDIMINEDQEKLQVYESLMEVGDYFEIRI
jgi:hypothetical protein